uniref:FIIND domain-containing protein n=1 Tax=Monopterus albus TaxID=43700 RepID=A0A3Q3K0E1_MONAL
SDSTQTLTCMTDQKIQKGRIPPSRFWTIALSCLERGKSGHLCLDCCPHDPVPDKRRKMDGWRFWLSGPGMFQCTLTGLVLVMSQEAELLYRTIQWGGSLLQNAVCQLRLPHCETKDGQLSVVHITDDGMSILEPLEITGTHVTVKVPHLSAFGLVWDFLKKFWNNSNPISGQICVKTMVMIYWSGSAEDKFFSHSVLLSLQVRVQHREAKYIKVPSVCNLIKGQHYTVNCPTACLIQPEKEEFNPQFGPNYYPAFQIRLPMNTEEVTITVQDQMNTEVWKRQVDLTDKVFTCRIMAPDVPFERNSERVMELRQQYVQVPTISNLSDSSIPT